MVHPVAIRERYVALQDTCNEPTASAHQYTLVCAFITRFGEGNGD
jgi:hypothetical protein